MFNFSWWSQGGLGEMNVREVAEEDPGSMQDKKELLATYITVTLILILAVSLTMCLTTENENSTMETSVKDNGTGMKSINLTNSQGKQIKVLIEVADEPEERGEGLMNQESLCGNCGMLFVYENDVTNSFWMKNTTIPLSIAFISSDGTIIDIQQMEPNTVTLHNSPEPYQYALEVNQGFFQENNISKEDKAIIPE